MYDLYKEVSTVLKTGRDLVSTNKGDTYELFKCWPSLAIACILRDLEGKTTFYKTLRESLVKFHHAPFYRQNLQ